MKPTVVICPGAWAPIKFFKAVIQGFEARGYPTIFDMSPGYPEHDPSATPAMNPDVKHIREKVLKPLINEGKDIVLLMHSYGGIYGSSSVQGLSRIEQEAKGCMGGVIALIYLVAFLAHKGTSAMEAMSWNTANPPQWAVRNKDGWISASVQHATAMLNHYLPADEVEETIKAMPRHPESCFTLPVHYDPFTDINFKGALGYIFCDADRVVPYDAQKKFVKTAGIEKTRLLKGASHFPQLEQPHQLVEAVLDLLRDVIEEEVFMF